MSSSSILSGTPAALAVNVNTKSLIANTASITGSASVGGNLGVTGAITSQNDLLLTNGAGANGIALAGAVDGSANPPHGRMTIATLNGAVAGDSYALSGGIANNLQIQHITGVGSSTVLNVDSTNVTTIGDGASTTPLKVSGPTGSSVVNDSTYNPAVIQFYAEQTLPEADQNVPSVGDAPITLLQIPIPASAQNGKYFVVDFLFNGLQENGTATADQWNIYLTTTQFAAYNSALSGVLTIDLSENSGNVEWTGATYFGAAAGAGQAFITGGRLSVWYKPPLATQTNTLYLTMAATSNGGGVLKNPFEIDGMVSVFN